MLDTARSFAWPLGTVALGLIVLLGVIRPAMKALAQPPASTTQLTELDGPEHQLDALEADQPDRPALGAPGANGANGEAPQLSASEVRMEDARKLTRDNPAAVANIVKAWINGEVPA